MKKRSFLQKNNFYTNVKKPLKLYRYQLSILLKNYLLLYKFIFINLFYFYKFIFILYRIRLRNFFLFVLQLHNSCISIFKLSTLKCNNHLRVLTFLGVGVSFSYKRLLFNNFIAFDKRFQYYTFFLPDKILPSGNTNIFTSLPLPLYPLNQDLYNFNNNFFLFIKQYYTYYIYSLLHLLNLNIFVFNEI